MKLALTCILAMLSPAVALLLSGVLTGAVPRWQALINIFAYPVLYVIAISLHELSHMVIARLVGLDVIRIQIGIGRRVAKVVTGSMSIHLNAIPFSGGIVFGASHLKWLRLRAWLAVAAGPGLHIALVALMLRWPAKLTLVDMLVPGHAALERVALQPLFLFINTVLAVINLIPATVRGQSQQLDGRRLLTLPLASRAQLEEFLASRPVMTAQAQMEKGDHADAERTIIAALEQMPTSFRLKFMLVSMRSKGDYVAAHDALLALAEQAPTSHDRLMVESQAAWMAYWTRDDARRDVANRLSLRAYERLKQTPWVMTTRGLVLTWLGRAAEAVKILEAAYTRESSPLIRANTACVTAIAYAAVRDTDQAARWREIARATNERCPLLSEATRCIDAARVDASPEQPAPSGRR